VRLTTKPQQLTGSLEYFISARYQLTNPLPYSSSCNLYNAVILRQCSDSTALLQAYAEVIPHSEDGAFQIQLPNQQYFYRYLDDAKTAPSNEVIFIRLCQDYIESLVMSHLPTNLKIYPILLKPPGLHH